MFFLGTGEKYPEVPGPATGRRPGRRGEIRSENKQELYKMTSSLLEQILLVKRSLRERSHPPWPQVRPAPTEPFQSVPVPQLGSSIFKDNSFIRSCRPTLLKLN